MLDGSWKEILARAVLVLAVLAPIAWCSSKIEQGKSKSANDLAFECIAKKGEWRADGWGPYRCVFPKE
jgi:hypothetical protein